MPEAAEQLREKLAFSEFLEASGFLPGDPGRPGRRTEAAHLVGRSIASSVAAPSLSYPSRFREDHQLDIICIMRRSVTRDGKLVYWTKRRAGKNLRPLPRSG